MNVKKLRRTIGEFTVVPMISLSIRLLVRLQGIPQIRRSYGDLFDALRDSAHRNYDERAKAKYDIHPTVYWGEDTLIYGDGEIKIGEHSYCGKGSFLLAHPKNTKLTIGKYCAISHNVNIRTEINKKEPHYEQDLARPPAGKDVTIGDYVWIGANVFIVGGIVVGDNSIIGANSVVTSDVPPNSIFAGVPATQIGLKSDYERT
jgi:maltose O-acetyltransferase